MTEITDDLISSFGEPKHVLRFRPQLIELEKEFVQRVKHIPRFTEENKKALLKEALYDSLKDLLAGNSGKYEGLVFCRGCNKPIRKFRLHVDEKNFVPLHDCVPSYELDNGISPEPIEPLNSDIAEAHKQMKQSLIYERKRLEDIQKIKHAKYLSVLADKSLGITNDQS